MSIGLLSKKERGEWNKMADVMRLYRVSYGSPKTPLKNREYILGLGSPVGTRKEWKEFAKKNGVKKLEFVE